MNHAKGYAALLEEHGEQAVRCCIDTWNQLCPRYPLTNVAEVARRKRWAFFGPDIVTLEQGGECGQISEITFGVSRRLSRSGLRRSTDSLLIIVNYSVYWNCGGTRVRGWSGRIVVDVEKDCVVQFPDVISVTPHVHWHPLP